MGERREVDRHPGTGQRALTHVLYTLREGFGPVDLGRNIPSREEQRATGPEVPQGPVCWEGVLGRNLRKKRSPEGLGNGQSHRIYILKVNSPAVEQTPKDLDGGLLGSLEPQNGFMFGIEALNLN